MTKYLQLDADGNVVYAMLQPQAPPLTPCEDDDPRYLAWMAASHDRATAAAMAQRDAIVTQQTQDTLGALVTLGVVTTTQIQQIIPTLAPAMASTDIQALDQTGVQALKP